MINELAKNPYFYIPLIAWIFTQTIKFVVHIWYGRFDWKYLIASGGMPSAHSAVVVSLATTAAILEGFSSPLFGILLVLAGIVIYDSFGVRRASGEQAVMINQLIEDLSSRREVGNQYKRLREFLGHKPLEVVVGSIVGFLLSGAVLRFAKINKYLSFDFLFKEPASFPLLKLILIFSGSLLIISLLLKGITFGKKEKGAKKKLLNKIFWWLFGGGLFGLIYSVLAYEGIKVISFPIFGVMGTVVWLIWAVNILTYFRKKFKQEHREWEERVRKEKWL